jgi:hypothetical protein
MAHECLAALRARIGYYAGAGINRENEAFTGEMAIRDAATGFAAWFRATGAGADVFHEEVVLIAPHFLRGDAALQKV